MTEDEDGSSGERIAERYAELRPLYSTFADRIEGLLNELLKAELLDVVQIESRAKDVVSLLDKVVRNPGKYPEPLTGIHDLAGVRIVAYYLSDVARIDAIIEREFDIDSENSWKKEDRVDPDRFGYASDHYVVSISRPRADLAEWRPFTELKAEIQVRTVLQHAWAAIDHKLVYKRAQDIPSELRRQLSRVSALLEVADEQFEAVRSASARLDANYDSRAKAGDLRLPVDVAAIRAYVQSSGRPGSIATTAETCGFIIDDKLPDSVAELTQASRLAGFTSISDLDRFLNGAEAWAGRVLPVLRSSSAPDTPWRMPTTFLLATLVLIGRDVDLDQWRMTAAADDFFIDGVATARARLSLDEI